MTLAMKEEFLSDIPSAWVLAVFAEAPLRGFAIEQALMRYWDDFDETALVWQFSAVVQDLRRKGHLELVSDAPPHYRPSRLGRRVLEFNRALARRKSWSLLGYRQLVGPWYACTGCGQKTRTPDQACDCGSS